MKRWGWLLLAVAVPRLVAFFFNENLGGDAIARTWLAHRWLDDPHVITSFAGGGKQFGPLHIYLLALAELVWPSLLHAGRVVSLIAGVATAWPLFLFTGRRFGEDAATLALLGLAFWGFHVQCSTTSASEALNLLLLVGAVERFDRGSLWSAALLLNLACATRYDSWLLVPLLALAQGARTRRVGAVVSFGLASSLFAIGWFIGNGVALGDPLFPIRYIDRFHQEWWPSEAATWGEGLYRLVCLGFWPGAAVLMLTPGFALAGARGAVQVWRTKPDLRWLVVLVVLPAVLYGLRGAVLASFAPLARFTVKELVLLLPLAGWWLAARSRRAQVLVVSFAAAWCVGLGALTWHPEGTVAFSLRSISAVSRMESAVRAPSDWLRENAHDGLLIVDEDPRGFDDLPVSYFSGLPFDLQLRRRFEHYREALGARTPRWLVLFEGGRLEREGDVTRLDATHVVFRDQPFELRFPGRISIYALTPRP